MTELTLRQVQVRLSEVLSIFVSYLESHGLQYYLDYGTLIGAARHQGFVPWDDDIDIVMPRKDYEKLINNSEVVDCYLSQYGYKFWYWQRGDYYFPFVKVSDQNTVVEAPYMRSWETKIGIAIDVFPLDGCPEFAWEEFCRYYKLNFDRVFDAKYNSNGWDTEYAEKYSGQLEYSKRIGDYELVRQQDYLCKLFDYDSSKLVGNLACSYKRLINRVPKDWFGLGVPLLFEGRSYNCPTEYDKLLNHMYGVWRVIPKYKEQHGYKVYEKD